MIYSFDFCRCGCPVVVVVVVVAIVELVTGLVSIEERGEEGGGETTIVPVLTLARGT